MKPMNINGLVERSIFVYYKLELQELGLIQYINAHTPLCIPIPSPQDHLLLADECR